MVQDGEKACRPLTRTADEPGPRYFLLMLRFGASSSTTWRTSISSLAPACLSPTGAASASLFLKCLALAAIIVLLWCCLICAGAHTSDALFWLWWHSRRRSTCTASDPECSLLREHPQCGVCGEKFAALKRRHHCRCCGEVVCSTCSPQR